MKAIFKKQLKLLFNYNSIFSCLKTWGWVFCLQISRVILTSGLVSLHVCLNLLLLKQWEEVTRVGMCSLAFPNTPVSPLELQCFPSSSLGDCSVCYNRNSLRPAPVLLGSCIAQISSASFHDFKVSVKKRRVRLLIENKKISFDSLYKGPKALLGYTSVLILTSYYLPIFLFRLTSLELWPFFFIFK